MQTFLPFPDFAASAAVLDDRRLGKQRVETLQILRALHCEGYGWAQHPAVTMWRGHTAALVAYGVATVAEWMGRGHADTTLGNIAEFAHPEGPRSQDELHREGRLPPWLGWESLHRSHRAALLRKDPVHYGPRFPADPDPPGDYVWPPPPAPLRPPGPRSAWVVRGDVHARAVAVAAQPGEEHWVPLKARTGRIPKRLRQVARFIDEIRPGDAVVVPEGSCLHLGEIRGDHRREREAHVRPVEWRGQLARSTLRFPASLQDPQSVFSLHDEPEVARAVRERGAAAPHGS